jgi:tyrosinase
MAEASRTTGYARVREILDAAAGASPADYEGVGRFWHLPLDELKEFRLQGVHLIAPPESAARSCCCGGGAAAGDPAGDQIEGSVCPGRGAASGLVQGLRGEPPFDGSRFPRLPWGGQPVEEENVRLISEWIDDGLPEAGRAITSFDAPGEMQRPVLEEIRPENAQDIARATHTAVTGADEYAERHGEVQQRMNLDCLSEPQLEKLRYAFRELYRLNKWPEDWRSYNNLALIHQNHCQHGWERFLPWHRIYLYEVEQALQDRVPGITLPYWDWIMPQYCPRHPERGWIIPQALQAYLTPVTIEWLKKAEPPITDKAAAALQENMAWKHYARLTGFFDDVVKYTKHKDYATGEHRERFIDALLAGNALWYPLRYPGQYNVKGKPSTINKVIHYHYPKPEDIAEILALRSFRDFGGGSLYNDSFGFLDQNPHNTMHIWTGGMNPEHKPAAAGKAQDFATDLQSNRNRGVRVAGRRFHTRDDMYSQPQYGDMFSNLTASYDPIFWPIHVNVDRLWWEWQQMNPHSLPADLDSVLTPWSYTIQDTLEISRFGYEYVRSSYVVPVGLGAPVGRFVSRPIAIPETVRAFRRAEVRLHRVPQLPRSCFVRVFLNLPDANAETSIEDDHYAGYLAIFGHGPCYGGPGHCDLPPSRPRKYDLRPPHKNTPRNHRINVTAAARRLLDAGAGSLQITLVVIGADYCEDHELLRLEGVSLSFLD